MNEINTTSGLLVFAMAVASVLPHLLCRKNFFDPLALAFMVFRWQKFPSEIVMDRSIGAKKCRELGAIAAVFPSRKVTIVNDDVNTAILSWRRKLDSKRPPAEPAA